MTPWQAVADGHAEVFGDMLPGARVGLVARAESRSTGGAMLAWEAEADGVTARLRPYRGLRDPGVDLLFVADEDALDALAAAPDEALAQLRRLVRRGNVVLYFLKCEGQLLDAGYEEFLDTLGLAFIGACR